MGQGEMGPVRDLAGGLRLNSSPFASMISGASVLSGRKGTLTMSSSAMITDHQRIPLPHPGEVLRSEFLEPMGLSVYALAKAIGVPRSRINEIAHGRQGITAAIALRLGAFFDVDPQWFMNMQSRYDLRVAAETVDVSGIIRVRAA
jgi:antitoxin HigA-1